jgi:hypothetical protein
MSVANSTPGLGSFTSVAVTSIANNSVVYTGASGNSLTGTALATGQILVGSTGSAPTATANPAFLLPNSIISGATTVPTTASGTVYFVGGTPGALVDLTGINSGTSAGFYVRFIMNAAISGQTLQHSWRFTVAAGTLQGVKYNTNLTGFLAPVLITNATTISGGTQAINAGDTIDMWFDGTNWWVQAFASASNGGWV